ncbi:hypothetical protein AB0L65_59915 [Nonomuraea sp. NPDC052116]|uniref:hypothetical protein n=1 Tax=Nonomuraea sp. NPDC052116 TaxID=3155665 RepID=UPI00342461A4
MHNAWRYLPTDLPLWQAVYWHIQQWERVGVAEALLTELRTKARRIIADTTGLLIAVAVVAAGRQDRDGAMTALLSAYLTTPSRHVSPTKPSRGS